MLARSFRIAALSLGLAALTSVWLLPATPAWRPAGPRALLHPGAPTASVFFPMIFYSKPALPPTLTPTPGPGRIVISEVMVNPDGDEPAGEWIELYNPGGTAISLNGIKVGDAWTAGDAEGMYAFPAGVWLAPGQALVIANQATAFTAVFPLAPDFELRSSDPRVPDLKRYTAWADRNVELTNEGDEVLLLDRSDRPIDGLSWGSSSVAFNPPVGRYPEGHTLERYPPFQDSDSALDWRECRLPSPGRVDLTLPTATQTATPTITRTPTATRTPTNTQTPTRGPSTMPTLTPTRTPTPTPRTPTPTVTFVRRKLLLSEVVYDPSGAEPGGEWIEIYNADSAPADLAGYRVGDEETRGGSEGMLLFPPGASISPGQTILIANQAAAFQAIYQFLPDFELADTIPEVPEMIHDPSWSSGGVNLANETPHDEVLILDRNDDLVDAVSWGSSTWAFTPAVADAPEGFSLERRPADQDCDLAADWQWQSAPQPGQVSLDAPEPTATITFTPSPSPTRTPTPTRTLSPTRSLTPSRTPSPTRTATPTRTPTSTRTPTQTVEPQPPLVINEILADPPLQAGDANGDGRIDAWQDDFIELVNHSEGPIDLSGWTIQVASGGFHVFPPGSLLAPRCAAVVFGGGTPTGDFGGSLVQTASSGRLMLLNFWETVSLFDPGGRLIAIYSYGPEGDNDQSLTRDPDVVGPEPLVLHSQAEGSAGARFSPGTRLNGQYFEGCSPYHR